MDKPFNYISPSEKGNIKIIIDVTECKWFKDVSKDHQKAILEEHCKSAVYAMTMNTGVTETSTIKPSWRW